MDNKKLEMAILDAALDANNPAGENYRSLSLAKTVDLADRICSLCTSSRAGCS
jgi:hypothetical protein